MQRTHDPQALLEWGKHVATNISQLRTVVCLPRRFLAKGRVWSCCHFLAQRMASQQRLNGLREGFAEHGEGWLRDEPAKHNVKHLHGVAAAAGVQRNAAGRQLSKPDLLEALSRCIAKEEASWGIDAMDDVSCPG